ncbi:hypothetical protein M427DRAFT_413334 [Gonapodya prolifera JEL478]|uniref:Uncharacterized protein n=1 Tax=Gonapodya prolifera (strain JEL478) TaxID=1344416 RepID=A0A139A5F9_GONPJ|nr:hypothetical protein M427DRAFT_413334 [Gonapodya prolifera JEL478]|eukprot:KXS12062.1 hypothetical protein M427DRAFT_413334 [Gonapodya prolifera JEL478]
MVELCCRNKGPKLPTHPVLSAFVTCSLAPAIARTWQVRDAVPAPPHLDVIGPRRYARSVVLHVASEVSRHGNVARLLKGEGSLEWECEKVVRRNSGDQRRT